MMNDLIEKLSNIRSQFNCFDENERDAYRTLSEAIKVISERPEPREDDVVSRADVLECYADLYDTFEDCSKEIINELHRKFEDLRTLPSVTPKRKKAEWLCSDDLYEYAVCSSCEWNSGESWEYVNRNFKFCPNCRADMRGEQNESN